MRMITLAAIASSLLALFGCSDTGAIETAVEFIPGETVDFTFESSGMTLSGVFDVPDTAEVHALIIIVHSYGETDVRNWISYSPERRQLNELGIATVLWDKPGLGRSEGSFDINQSVHESAQEVLDAAAHLRKIGAPGADKIGLWGGSRAGWIAPIALSQDASLEFWVSLSGTTAEDNFTYLLLSNLPYEGASEQGIAQIEQEWRAGCELYRTGADYDAYLEATEFLRSNEYIVNQRGDWPSRAQYWAGQRRCENGTCPNTDNDYCDYVWIEDFDDMLSSLDIDVLALFGEKDLNINWRKTRALYETTIGNNPDASLTLHAFADADHALNVSETGSLREMRESQTRTKTADYFEVQRQWLQTHVLPKQ